MGKCSFMFLIEHSFSFKLTVFKYVGTDIYVRKIKEPLLRFDSSSKICIAQFIIN